MKELLIIRHAKSSWKDLSLRDFDRPLNKRGKENAPFMADRISKMEGNVDFIVSSPANRAFSTAVIFGKAFNITEAIVTNELIYEASVQNLMHVINHIPGEANKAIIVGHNPGLSMLVDYLCDEAFHLPTCAVVKIRFETNDWGEVFGGTGEKMYFDYPKAHQQP